MSLEDKIMTKLKEAMKAKDKKRLEALRAVKNAIIQEKTKDGSTEIDEATELKMLQKLVKQRDDSSAIYRKENRPELAEQEEFEAEVIREFLPQPLTDDEVVAIIEKIIADTGAESMKDMGKVMGLATKETAGRADGKFISEVVRKKLQ